MNKNIETKIRLNVVLLYLLIALVFVGFIFFFYSLYDHLNDRKITYEEYYKELETVNELSSEINRIQMEANLYISTRDIKHLDNFLEQICIVEDKIDSLVANSVLSADTMWSRVNTLLKVKEISIMTFNDHLTEQDEIISQQDKSLSKTLKSSTNKNVQDTIVQGASKKKFWERVANVFNPEEKEDTIIVVKEERISIINEKAAADVDKFNKTLRRNQANYAKRIEMLEEQMKHLFIVDQEISSMISDLLIQLNSDLIHSRWEELEAEELQMRQNNTKAVILGIVALSIILIFVVLILVDINKGQVLRKKLEQANIKNKEIMESRHKLLLSVSHDIKSPLNCILGYLQIFQQTNNISKKELASMQNSGKHILSLVSNLLEYSGLEQGKVSLQTCDFSLEELCDELYEMFIPVTNARNLYFTYEKDFDPALIIKSDPVKIRQILTNVLSNAIKFTQEGGVIFKITYGKKSLGFSVIDSGIGIPEDKLKFIYKPFTRINIGNSFAEGSGFGMYVVKGLVTLFNGKIQYKSKVDDGTSVLISLPVEEGKLIQPDLSAKKLLLIDDDEVFIKMISGMCRQLGHTVSICRSLREFKDILPQVSLFDIVLTDMEMATFTGQEVLEKIRNITDTLPVYLMTGHMDYSNTLALSGGFSGCLNKPVTIESLCSVVGGSFNKQAEQDCILSDAASGKPETEVIQEFICSSVNNIVYLHEAVNGNDFERARFICHKMLPMCILLNAKEDMINILKEIEGSGSGNITESCAWRDKIMILTDKLEVFLTELQEIYLQDETEEN